MRTVLVTGSCGFIGANFVHLLARERPDWKIISYDNLTYAGNVENLTPVKDHPNHSFIKGDICDRSLVEQTLQSHHVDTIVNFAAESHVDRSISGPEIFVQTNVLGTQVLLEAARLARVTTFIQISTDEVYGSLGDTGYFTEASPICPSSPYSASKAGADHIALAYAHTYKMNIVVTRCSNNYGPYQFPEKLIPLVTINAMHNTKLPVYGTGKNVRDWIHVEDHCRGVLAALEKGKPGEVYNFGGGGECANIEIVKRILSTLQKPESLIEFVPDRLGHDWRYAIDSSKSRKELDWSPNQRFETGLRETIRWYQQSETWWRPLLQRTTAKIG